MRCQLAEEKISKLVDRSIEIILPEEQKEKKMKMNRALDTVGHQKAF